MIKAEEAHVFTSCDSCGKRWDETFRKMYVMGGARYISIPFVLCGDCRKTLKEML